MDSKTSLTERTFVGIFWMMFGRGFQAILQFSVVLVLARLLSPYDFGVTSAAAVVTSFVIIFSMIGVGPVIVQRPVLTEAHVRTGFTVTVLLSIAFTVLLYFGSSYVADFFRIPELTNVIKVTSSIFLMQGFSVVAESLLERDLKFKLIIMLDVTSYIFYGIIGVILALLGFSYWSLVYALVFQNIVKLVMTLYFSRHNMIPYFDMKVSKELYFYGGGFTLEKFISQFANEADNFVIGRFLGAGALGLYGRAYQMMVMPATLFGSVIDKVLFPAMAQVQDDPKKLEESFRIGLTSVSITTIPISILVWFLAEDIVYILFGADWLGLVPALKILSLGLLFRNGDKICDSLIQAVGAVYRRAYVKGIYAIAIFIGVWFGKEWGIEGVALGVLAGIIINFILMANLTLKFIEFTWLDFLIAYLPALRVGLYTVGVSLVMEYLTGLLGLNAPLKILLTGVLLVTTLTLLYLINAQRLLGKDILWIRSKIVSMARKRMAKSAAKNQV